MCRSPLATIVCHIALSLWRWCCIMFAPWFLATPPWQHLLRYVLRHNVEPHSAHAEWSSLLPLLPRLPSPRIEPNHPWCSRLSGPAVHPPKWEVTISNNPYYDTTNESFLQSLVFYLYCKRTDTWSVIDVVVCQAEKLGSCHSSSISCILAKQTLLV